jgi:hypothetical protein
MYYNMPKEGRTIYDRDIDEPTLPSLEMLHNTKSSPPNYGTEMGDYYYHHHVGQVRALNWYFSRLHYRCIYSVPLNWNIFSLRLAPIGLRFFLARIPNEDQVPLRIAVLSIRLEPKRVPMTRFMASWVCNAYESLSQRVPSFLRSSYENMVVWRSHTMTDWDRK